MASRFSITPELCKSLLAQRPDQMTVARDPAQIITMAMGRRWGKTTLGGALCMGMAAQGARVAWVVPTYRNSRPLWRFCQRMIALTREPYRVNQSEMTIEAGYGWLGIYSAENDTALRGEAFDRVVIDEAPLVRAETWTDVIMPTLADRNGKALLIGTPKGRNWFYTEFMRGIAGERGYRSYHAPTKANPLPNIQRFYHLARQRMSDRTFLQELDAEFIELAGLTFRNVDALATLQPQEAAIEGHLYVGGIDWARENDSTVFCVLDVTAQQMAYLDRMHATDYKTQAARLQSLHERFQVQTWISEYNSMGGPMTEQLQNDGLPVTGFVTTNASKAQLVDALSLTLENGALGLLDDAVLKSELKAYAGERLPSGVMRYSAPEGMHDDTVMALALAFYAMPMSGDIAV